MGKFKMQSPIKLDPVPRYDVPFMPDNVEDNSGLVAKANKNGTMIVNKNIPKNSKLYKQAKSHEDHHLKDMMQGKLDYDANAVYHNLDGKGVKKVDRAKFDESNKNLPWEKKAYKAGVAMEDKDMRPNPNKLDGPPNMMEKDTPLSYYKIGSKPRRESDMDSVSMNERFGNAMVKKFGPAKTGCAISKYGGPAKINLGPDTDPSGEGEDEKTLKQKAQQAANEKLAQMEYQSEVLDDGRIRYFKSAEGDASETITNPGGQGASGGTIRFEDAYKNADKEKYPTLEEFTIAAKAYNEKMKKPSSSTRTERATASDEYFEKAPPPPTTETPPPTTKTPPPTITTTNGEDRKKEFKFKFKGRNKDKGLKNFCTPDNQSTECVGAGNAGFGGLKPDNKGGSLTTKKMQKQLKKERKQRDRKVFDPVGAAKEFVRLGKYGRKAKRGGKSAQRGMNRARRRGK